MKRLFFTMSLAVLLGGTVLGAKPAASADFKLAVAGDRVFSMVVDGKFHINPTTMAHLQDLRPGNHFIEVYATPVAYGPYRACGNELLFSGKVYLSPGMLTRARIDRGNHLVVKLVKPKNKHLIPAYCGVCGGPCTGACGAHPGAFGPAGPCQGGHSGACGSSCGFPVNWDGSAQVIYNGGGYAAPLGNKGFRELLQTLDRTAFESTKRELAFDALAQFVFTSDQVSEILRHLAFENTKLEIAKAAFDRCVDPHNYQLVADALTFESSKRDLYQFIRA
jgi:hypothetical protein